MHNVDHFVQTSFIKVWKKMVDIVQMTISKSKNDGLVQERHNSIANALELRLSCTNPSNGH